MCRRSCVLCCCMLLFVASSSDSRKNFTNDDEKSRDSMVLYDFYAKDSNDKDESIQYNSKIRENSTMNDDKFHINSTKNNHDNDDLMGYDFRAHMRKNDEESYQTKPDSITTRFMKDNDENNSVSQEIYGNFTKTEGENNTIANNNNTFPPEECENSNCIQLCCPRGDRLIQRECVAGKDNYSFPDVYWNTSDDSSQSEDKSFDEIFHLIVHDPCLINERQLLISYDEYIGIFPNGSLYLSIYESDITWTDYCLGVVNQDAYDVLVCTSTYPISVSISLLVSLPFLAVTFVVYSILPELQNMHGYTLRAHIASLFVSYAILPVKQQMDLNDIGFPICILLAYLFTFSITASFLWLNVICFDIWQTFREIRSSQGNTKQQEKKKFMLYSIYAWGGPLLLTIICAITDYIPDLPEYVIRPKYCQGSIWFGNDKAQSLYVFLPVGITVICNICLFVITMFKIIRYKKRTANDLKNSESKCHDDNKQRFMMYLKLLIVMGITWILEILGWIDSEDVLIAIWYPADMLNALQGFFIFVIFVCRKKIKRLLFKRLGWQDCNLQDCNLLSCNSASNDGQSTTTSRSVSLEEINPRTEN